MEIKLVHQAKATFRSCFVARWRGAVALVTAGLVLAVLGCTDRETLSDVGPLPVAATAYPSPEGRNVTVAKNAPQDIQELTITITPEGFSADRYAAQSSATRLAVTTQGGPYTFAIDPLLPPQQLAADTTTRIGLTLPDPGDYTMRLSGAATDMAVLNVRPLGGR
jgi:hypothetical protein